MTPDSGPPSQITSLAAGVLRGEEVAAWALFEAVWPAMERYVREHGLAEGLRQAVEALQAASRETNSVNIPKAARIRLAAGNSITGRRSTQQDNAAKRSADVIGPGSRR